MEKIRPLIGDFYRTRRREFMMVVLLFMLFVYNVFAYLSGDKYNLIAVLFGPRGAAAPSGQSGQGETQTAPLSQSVKESQELDDAAQNLSPSPTGTAAPSAAPPSSASPAEKTEQAPPAQLQTVSPPQGAPAVTPAAVIAVYTELGRDYFYRDDPFKPVVVPVKVTAVSFPKQKWRTPAPEVRGPCGSILQAAYSGTSFAWPSERNGEDSGDSGLPPLPGMGEEGAAAGKTASSPSGGLKLTGVIFDSHPVALIRFNGKDINVRMNERIGSCKVLVIAKNQVVLAEPDGKQRRLFL